MGLESERDYVLDGIEMVLALVDRTGAPPPAAANAAVADGRALADAIAAEAERLHIGARLDLAQLATTIELVARDRFLPE